MESLESILQWYHETPADSTSINDAIYYRKEFCAHTYLMATELGRAKMLWNTAEYSAKTKLAELKLMYINKGCKIGESEANAKLDCRVVDKVEKEREAEFYSLKFQLEAIYRIIDELQQRISFLKSEKNFFEG